MAIRFQAIAATLILALVALWFGGTFDAHAHPLDEVVICDNAGDLYVSPDPLGGGGSMTGGMGGDGPGAAGVGPPPGCRSTTPQAGEAAPSLAPPPDELIVATALRFIGLGFTHILPDGLDHMLFVLGLFFSSIVLRPLLWQITAFTVAHSLTLALAALGIIDVPAAIIEPLIAISIVWVGVENVLFKKPLRFRPAVIFAFGLAHGIGFAGAIAQVGFPAAQFLTALVTFNIGVELGQIAVLLIAFMALRWFFDAPWYRSRVVVPASLMIALLAFYWAVERIVESAA